jgi:hypothetical protein
VVYINHKEVRMRFLREIMFKNNFYHHGFTTFAIIEVSLSAYINETKSCSVSQLLPAEAGSLRNRCKPTKEFRHQL